jgi:hypothetical protein
MLVLDARRMRDLADHLDDAVRLFRSWNIRVIDVSRLVESARLLRQVSTCGHFPNSGPDLMRVAHAARDAQEFAEISWVLPPQQLKPLADDLQRAVQGQLGVGATQPVQFQTQLWVGAMLAQSGARTGVITGGAGKRPDYIITEGTLRYPIEVKRPTHQLRADSIISDAARQLCGPRYHGSMIVVDLTDCLNPATAARVGNGPPEHEQLQNETIRLSGELHREIFDNKASRLRSGRQHIFALVTFGRAIYWDEDDLSQAHLSRYVASVVYWRRNPSTLRAHRARYLAELIHQGVTAVGHHQLSRTHIDF